jgi:hypothetical protein
VVSRRCAICIVAGLVLAGCGGLRPEPNPTPATAERLENGRPGSAVISADPELSGNQTLPPAWYWYERQSQQLERQLQQQRNEYYLNRQPAPQFQRPPTCQSYVVGGQVYTHCQ